MGDTGPFDDCFRSATPIDIIERMTLGSSLRAISRVFTWTQFRAGLPGWYGTGTALVASVNGVAQGLQNIG